MRLNHIHVGVHDLRDAVDWLDRVWQVKSEFQNERMATFSSEISFSSWTHLRQTAWRRLVLKAKIATKTFGRLLDEVLLRLNLRAIVRGAFAAPTSRGLAGAWRAKVRDRAAVEMI
jgi:hypothetical protein